MRAEQAGFGFALVSDHYHPWIDRQGQSSFVWSVVGGIAASTSSIRLGTGVTCPLIRIHPAIVAQAAATSAALMPGRFFLGVATGENLNEHCNGPTYGMLTVCWAASEDLAQETALEYWPNAGLAGTLGQELPLPSHFEQAAEMVDEKRIAEVVVCGPDPEAHLEGIRRFADAGFDHVYVHQVGPDQEGFMDFYGREVLDEVERIEPGFVGVAA